MAINFENELPNHGYEKGRDAFYSLAQEVFAAMYPAWTVDDLACHPSEALKYCEAVRQKASANVPEELIMHALMNARKRGGPIAP
jgi:hypothetical protein